MRRLDLIKTLVMREIRNHSALVRNACENEMYCFETYLRQVRDRFEKMPTSRLESLVKGIELKRAS